MQTLKGNRPRQSSSAAVPPRFGGPTFSRRNRMARALWTMSWTLLAAWTPSPFMPWRRGLLRVFGARLAPTAIVRSSARIWWPGNLEMGDHASLGPGAICYNVAPVTIGAGAIVSQRAHLCTAGHDIDDAGFPLVSRPIVVGKNAWVAAEAFVGPGVRLGDGAVLGARAVTVRDLAADTVYVGNPARPVRLRSHGHSTP
ncbi:MAG TPA: putative colanic acid biosynthesis acetyltransferase [Devosiaceae bacterium]